MPAGLLGIEDLSREEIEAILNRAKDYQPVQDHFKRLDILKGRMIVNLFFEDSTRTRSSFEIAAKWMSADAVNMSAKGSSVSKGDSLRDTVLTLDAMGVDAMVIRHSGSGAAQQAAGWVKASVINAGDGAHEHPTQALLDAFTMRRHLAGGALSQENASWTVRQMAHCLAQVLLANPAQWCSWRRVQCVCLGQPGRVRPIVAASPCSPCPCLHS